MKAVIQYDAGVAAKKQTIYKSELCTPYKTIIGARRFVVNDVFAGAIF